MSSLTLPFQRRPRPPLTWSLFSPPPSQVARSASDFKTTSKAAYARNSIPDIGFIRNSTIQTKNA